MYHQCSYLLKCSCTNQPSDFDHTRVTFQVRRNRSFKEDVCWRHNLPCNLKTEMTNGRVFDFTASMLVNLPVTNANRRCVYNMLEGLNPQAPFSVCFCVKWRFLGFHPSLESFIYSKFNSNFPGRIKRKFIHNDTLQMFVKVHLRICSCALISQ